MSLKQRVCKIVPQLCAKPAKATPTKVTKYVPAPQRCATSESPQFTTNARPSGVCQKEAVAWLSANKNEVPFAGNAFQGKRPALAAANALYAAGASCVSVSGIYNEPQRIERECGPYAATFIISAPAAKRASVTAAAKKLDPNEQDWKNNKLRLWWD